MSPTVGGGVRAMSGAALALLLMPAGAAAQSLPPAATSPAPAASDIRTPASEDEDDSKIADDVAPAEPNRAGSLSMYGLYDRRYRDSVVVLDAYKPLGGPEQRIRPYLAVFYTRDARTSIDPPEKKGRPPVPLLFADNYALAAAGLQFTDGNGLRAFVQAGGSTPRGPVAAQPSGGDLRAGIQVDRQYGPQFDTRRAYGGLFASVTYVSRYSNWVAYVQRELVRNLGSESRPAEAFARATLSFDSRTFYYSNFAEGTAGLRLYLIGRHGPILSLEQSLGTTLRGAVPAKQSSGYNDFRPALSLGVNF